MYKKLKDLASRVKLELCVWRLVMKDPRTPRLAKILLAVGIGYLLMPFELIPDFIPVIGYLDDVIITGLLVFIALKLIPPHVVQENRIKAAELENS